MTKGYDVVLCERPLDMGLSLLEIKNVLSNLSYDENGYIPIEFTGDFGVAMGFIGCSSSELLDYDYDKKNEDGESLSSFVIDILNDMEKETKDFTYIFTIDKKKIKILLSR